jgi:hypothetical protein
MIAGIIYTSLVLCEKNIFASNLVIKILILDVWCKNTIKVL